MPAPPSPRTLWTRVGTWRPTVPFVALATMAGIYFAAASNAAFWHEASHAGAFAGADGFAVAGALFVLMAGVHTILLCVLLPAMVARSGLTVLIILAAIINDVAIRSGVDVDAGFADPIARIAAGKLRDLATPALLLSVVAQTALPLILLWRLELQRTHWLRSFAERVLVIVATLGVMTAVAMMPYHELLTLGRNHGELRRLVTSANLVEWIADSVLPGDNEAEARNRR